MTYSTTELINKMVHLRHEFKKSLDDVLATYPYINVQKDARITFFSKSFTVMDSVILCLICADKYMPNISWWTRTAKPYGLKAPEPEFRPAMLMGFHMFILESCFHFLFSSFESSLRLMAKKSNKTRYEKDDRFKNIYCWFLGGLKFHPKDLKKYLKLLDVLRLIRNTIHNNGVYSPTFGRKGNPPKNRQITYGGIKCKFIVGRAVKVKDFWELVFITTPDVLVMMKSIIGSSVISSIKTQIRDPSVDKNLIPLFHP